MGLIYKGQIDSAAISPAWLATKGDYLYVVDWDANGWSDLRLKKIQLSTFMIVDNLYINTGDGESVGHICVVDDYLYVLGHTESGYARLYKIDLMTFDAGDTTYITLSGGFATPNALCWDGNNHLYAISDYNKIYKINISTFSEEAVLTAPDGFNWGMRCCVHEGYLYCLGSSTDDKVWKIDLSTFTHSATLTIETGYNNPYDLVASGNYLYVSLGKTATGNHSRIVKVNLTTFTVESTINLDDINSSYTWASYLSIYLNSLYVSLLNINGRVIQLGIPSLSYIASSMEMANSSLRESLPIFHANKPYLYVADSNYPTKEIYKYEITGITVSAGQIKIGDTTVGLGIDCERILAFDISESADFATKPILGRKTPTIEGEIFVTSPKIYKITARVGKIKRDSLQTEKDNHETLLFIYDESIADSVKFEEFEYRWAGQEEHTCDWLITLTLVSTTK